MPNPRHLLPLLAFTTVLRGDPLDNVRRAEAMLGPGIWTRGIRIENATAHGRYPETVHALIFELSGILWFYSDTDGTQSLSTHLGTAERDKADIGKLLLEIDPGFTRWVQLPPGPVPDAGKRRIPNGCFIESVALLRERLELGLAANEPRLLSYYVRLPDGIHGHTVLQFRAAESQVVVDPDRPGRTVGIRPRLPDDAGSCIACLRGDVARARWIHLNAAEVAGHRMDARALQKAALAQAAVPMAASTAL
jgi:hypothetical protein